MAQQKHRRPRRNFTIRKDGYITKSQLGKRGTILPESQLLDFEVKRKLERTTAGVTVITVEDLNAVRLFRYNDIEKAEKELMLENFHDISMRKRFCEIWNIEMEAHHRHPFFARRIAEAWTLGHPKRMDRFLSCESFSMTFLGGRLTYPIYLKSDVRKVERSDDYKNIVANRKRAESCSAQGGERERKNHPDTAHL